MSSTRSKWIPRIVAILVVWIVAILIWAARPLHDRVDAGTDFSQDPAKALTFKFECASVFESQPKVSPLPTLPAQPEGHPALVLEREPCIIVHREARIAFAIDIVAVALGAALVIGLARSSRRHPLARVVEPDPAVV